MLSEVDFIPFVCIICLFVLFTNCCFMSFCESARLGRLSGYLRTDLSVVLGNFLSQMWIILSVAVFILFILIWCDWVEQSIFYGGRQYSILGTDFCPGHRKIRLLIPDMFRRCNLVVNEIFTTSDRVKTRFLDSFVCLEYSNRP